MNVVSLVFAGILGLAGTAAAQADREVVKVNGTSIRQSEVFERLWKAHGTETLDEMIDELLLRQASQAAKIKADAAEIDRRYAKLRSTFSDPKAFEAQLAKAGTTPEKIKAEIGEQIAREKLIAGDKKLSIGEAELKKAFDEHKADLGQRESLHLRHMLVAQQKDADSVMAAIKGGADFTKVAREKSLAPTGKVNGGDYGFVSKGMLPAEIEEIAFGMKNGELRVIPGASGLHILQALERRPAVPAEFSKVKGDLKELMMQQKIKAVLPEFLRELRAKADIKAIN